MEHHSIVVIVLMDIALCVRTVLNQCGNIPAIANSENNLVGSPPYPEGTTVDFGCSNAYIPQGHPSYTCTGGEWTEGSFSCHAAECSALEEPLHGQMIGDNYEVGSVMSFQCNIGYNLVGETALICMSDLDWEPPNVPQCQIKTCPAVPSVQHGNVFEEQTIDGQNNVYGAIFGVLCNDNYMKSGPARIHCDENGAWTEKPKCEPVTCPQYSGLDAKCVLKSKLQASNTLLLLYCTDNATFVHQGDGTAFCDEGIWDDPSMRCYCNCKITADTHYVQFENLDAKGFLKHGDTLVWNCKHGATKASTVPLTCNDGSAGTPECVSGPAIANTTSFTAETNTMTREVTDSTVASTSSSTLETSTMTTEVSAPTVANTSESTVETNTLTTGVTNPTVAHTSLSTVEVNTVTTDPTVAYSSSSTVETNNMTSGVTDPTEANTSSSAVDTNTMTSGVTDPTLANTSSTVETKTMMTGVTEPTLANTSSAKVETNTMTTGVTNPTVANTSSSMVEINTMTTGVSAPTVAKSSQSTVEINTMTTGITDPIEANTSLSTIETNTMTTKVANPTVANTSLSTVETTTITTEVTDPTVANTSSPKVETNTVMTGVPDPSVPNNSSSTVETNTMTTGVTDKNVTESNWKDSSTWITIFAVCAVLAAVVIAAGICIWVKRSGRKRPS